MKTPEATASATSYAVTISWETVSGASGYKAVLKEAGAVVKEQSVDADALSCTFGELTPDRDYAVAVQALYESKPEYNSEFTADIAVHTPALLTRPVVHLYDGFEVTHNMAIVEWDIDAAQQSDTKTSLQLLEVGAAQRQIQIPALRIRRSQSEYDLHGTHSAHLGRRLQVRRFGVG